MSADIWGLFLWVSVFIFVRLCPEIYVVQYHTPLCPLVMWDGDGQF